MTIQSEPLELRLLNHATATEARAWLAREDGVSRSLGAMGSSERSKRFVEELYAAGAISVIATEIDRYEREQLESVERHENTGKLLVELPTGPVDRRMLFRIQGKVARGLGFDPTVDDGRRYLFFMLD